MHCFVDNDRINYRLTLLFTFWMAKTFSGLVCTKSCNKLTYCFIHWRSYCQPHPHPHPEASPTNLSAEQCIGSSCTLNGGAASSWDTRIHCVRHGPPNNPDIRLVDYCILGVMQERVYQTPIQDVAELQQRLTSTWNSL